MSEPISHGLAQCGNANLASTQWSVVLHAGGDRNAPSVQEALTRLCSTYWYPLYVFIRRQGHDAHAAEDLTQEFFARFLEQGALESVDQSRGRFRTFLLACCRHFLANEYERIRAQKRGGGQRLLALDLADAAERYKVEATTLDTPERLFARRWALTVLEKTLNRIREEYNADGKGELFDHLKNSLTSGADALPYVRSATILGMTEAAVKKAAQRVRQRYREILREQIADTVDDPGTIDQEIRDLFAALSA